MSEQGDDGKRTKVVLIVLAVVGVAGYACLAWGGLRDDGHQQPRPMEGGILRRFTGVPLDEVTLERGDWQSPGVCLIPAGLTRTLRIAGRTSRILRVRSLGVRFTPVVGEGQQQLPPMQVTVTYAVDDDQDPRIDQDLKATFTEERKFPITDTDADGKPPDDPLRADLSLFLCPGTITIVNRGDGAVRLELSP